MSLLIYERQKFPDMKQPCFFCLKNQVNIFDGCETLTLYSNINKDDRGNEF